jgi:hypothetical protein
MNRKKAKQARAAAAEELDQLCEWSAAINREGRCPCCEAPVKLTPVGGEAVPERLRQSLKAEAEGWEALTVTHAPGCRMAGVDARTRELGERWGFRYTAQLFGRMASDGSVVQLYTRYKRIPERGDPPIAPEYLMS